MGLIKWKGSDSDFKHESIQIKQLTIELESWSQKLDYDIHMMTNFLAGGEEIDVALVLKYRIIVIDLKTGGGLITGGENGDWICKPVNGKEFLLNKGRKNPFIQASRKRYALKEYLENKKHNIFKHNKKDNMTFYLTASIIVFSNDVTKFNHRDEIQPKSFNWFAITSLNKINEQLDNYLEPVQLKHVNSYKKTITQTLYLEESESVMIPNELHLYKIDNKKELSFNEDIEISNEKDIIEVSVNEKKIGVDSDEGISEPSIDKGNQFKKKISGTLDKIDNNIPYIKTKKDNLIYEIILNTEFNEAINDLNKLSDRIINRSDIDINLINVHIDKENKTITLNRDIESYLVIEPSWLINVSALANFDFCERKFFHNRFQGTSQNEAMIRGSIVHEVFEDVLKNKPIDEIVKTQWKDSFHKRSLDFAINDINHNDVWKFSSEHINALSNPNLTKNLTQNIISVDTERFIINPDLGLKGKIDAVIKIKDKDGFKNKAVELKTGKSWGGNAKPGHAFQIRAYSLLMEMKGKDRDKQLDPSVIYSGDWQSPYNATIVRDVPINYEGKSQIINLRNTLVLADYTFKLNYEKNKINKCKACMQYEPEICNNLYNLEQKHDPNNIPIYDIKKNQYNNEEILFFNNTYRLFVEEFRTIKEGQGRFLQKEPEQRILEKKSIKIIEHEIFDDKNFEYTLSCENESEFREMDRCLISDKNGPIHGECLEATIIIAKRNYIRIKCRSTLEIDNPKYLDYFNSESIFERNFFTIYEMVNNKSYETIKRIIIYGDAPKQNIEKRLEFNDLNINESQKRAVSLSLGIEDYLLIQGPPGSGKTTTIGHIVNRLHSKEKKIILSCFTHRAIDEVLNKINEINPSIEIYRIGVNSEDSREFQNCKILDREINKEPNEKMEQKIKRAKNIISNSSIFIGTTHAWLSCKYDNIFKDNSFDVAIIDEASQSLIANTLGVTRLTKSFILVGDHKQLSPVIQSKDAQELSETLFEKLIKIANKSSENDNTSILLKYQYRMPQVIADFISNEFYDGKLKTDSSCRDNHLAIPIKNNDYIDILDKNNSLVLINMKSINTNVTNLEKINKKESECICNILNELLENTDNIILFKKIGIIAPFRAQVARIRRDIEKKIDGKYFNDTNIKDIVDTIDRFQGDERDVILFSLTLNDNIIPDILNDPKRLNVALSRAKQKLIIVGDWGRAENSKILLKLKEYAKTTQGAIYLDQEK